MSLSPGGLAGDLRRVQRAVVQVQQELAVLQKQPEQPSLDADLQSLVARVEALEAAVLELTDGTLRLDGGAP